MVSGRLSPRARLELRAWQGFFRSVKSSLGDELNYTYEVLFVIRECDIRLDQDQGLQWKSHFNE